MWMDADRSVRVASTCQREYHPSRHDRQRTGRLLWPRMVQDIWKEGGSTSAERIPLLSGKCQYPFVPDPVAKGLPYCGDYDHQ